VWILQEPVIWLCSGCWNGEGWRFSFDILANSSIDVWLIAHHLVLVSFASDEQTAVKRMRVVLGLNLSSKVLAK